MRFFILFTLLIFLWSCSGKPGANPYIKPEEFGARGDRRSFPFYIYSDHGAHGRLHFFPSGFMGDTFNLTITGGCRENPISGRSCIRVDYDPVRPQKAVSGWSGVCWLTPPDNWGVVKGAGYNLNGASRLVIHVRGRKGGEKVVFFVGGVSGNWPDSGKSKQFGMVLKKHWERKVLSLKGMDLKHIIGGLTMLLKLDDNPAGAVFFLDEIYFE